MQAESDPCRYFSDHRPAGPKTHTLFASMVANDGIGFYPDWPVAGYYNDLVSATQNLMNGTDTVSAFLDEIAAPYNAAIKEIRYRNR